MIGATRFIGKEVVKQNIKKYDSYLLGISRLRYLMGYTR